MPGKKGGKKSGKGGRRRGKGGDDKRELLFRKEGQEYGAVRKMLGSGRCDVYCFDGMERRVTIRGSLMKRVWINVGDIVLVDLRGFEPAKGDISHRFTPDEARLLKAHSEIPATVKINETGAGASDPAAALAGDDEEEGAYDFMEAVEVDIDAL